MRNLYTALFITISATFVSAQTAGTTLQGPGVDTKTPVSTELPDAKPVRIIPLDKPDYVLPNLAPTSEGEIQAQKPVQERVIDYDVPTPVARPATAETETPVTEAPEISNVPVPEKRPVQKAKAAPKATKAAEAEKQHLLDLAVDVFGSGPEKVDVSKVYQAANGKYYFCSGLRREFVFGRKICPQGSTRYEIPVSRVN